jgi:hypothetical protein
MGIFEREFCCKRNAVAAYQVSPGKVDSSTVFVLGASIKAKHGRFHIIVMIL